jgi:uncharacterized protein
VVLVSWAFALFEYCITVPTKRLGYAYFSGFQLNIIQEVVTSATFYGVRSIFSKRKVGVELSNCVWIFGSGCFFCFCF